MKEFPNIPSYQLFLSSAYFQLGRMVLARGEASEATSHLETAIAHQEAFLNAASHGGFARGLLSGEYQYLAKAQAECGKVEQAKSAYEMSVALAEPLLVESLKKASGASASTHGSHEFLKQSLEGMSKLYGEFADVLEKAGDPDRARSVREQAHAVDQQRLELEARRVITPDSRPRAPGA